MEFKSKRYRSLYFTGRKFNDNIHFDRTSLTYDYGSSNHCVANHPIAPKTLFTVVECLDPSGNETIHNVRLSEIEFKSKRYHLFHCVDAYSSI